MTACYDVSTVLGAANGGNLELTCYQGGPGIQTENSGNSKLCPAVNPGNGMETPGDQRRLRDTRAENWKKWGGASGALRKGQSRLRQVQMSCADACQEDACLFASTAFNSGTEIW